MSNPINLIKILNKLITKKFSRNHANYIFFVTSKCNQNCEFCNLAREIITKYPNLYLQVCISLDGPEWFHDKIRGINGAYKKSIESIKKLEDLARRYEKLSLNINTVITHENLSIIPEII